MTRGAEIMAYEQFCTFEEMTNNSKYGSRGILIYRNLRSVTNHFLTQHGEKIEADRELCEACMATMKKESDSNQYFLHILDPSEEDGEGVGVSACPRGRLGYDRKQIIIGF